MNNSSSGKFAKITAKAVMLLLAVCLVLAAVPQLAPSTLTFASAETYTLTANDAAQLNSDLASYASSDPGCVVDVTLTRDIDFSNVGGDVEDAEYKCIYIPAGITVNLYMNGHVIAYDCPSRDAHASWQAKIINAIENHGTLNIYSGSKISPNSTGGAEIRIDNQRKDMSISEDEHAYAREDAIINYGMLTVNKGVKIKMINYIGYDDIGFFDRQHRGSATVAATGIYNEGDAAVCTVNSATIDVLSEAHAFQVCNSTNENHARCFAYGIYGGTVTVNGDTNISIDSLGRSATTDSPAGNDQKGSITSVAYGICSDKAITVNGGSIIYWTRHDCNQGVTAKGTSSAYEGGICYKTVPPVITDCTIAVKNPDQKTYVRGDNKTYREATVTQAPVLPYSGKEIFCNDSTPGTTYGGLYKTYNEPSKPAQDVTAGQYTDENGNVYPCPLNTTDAENNHAEKIENGAPFGTYRVHVVYRYWLDQNKNNIDTSVVGTTGLAGYSFYPLIDGTDIVKNAVVLNGVTDPEKMTKTKEAGVSYVSGGEPHNSNYWTIKNIAYMNINGEFSDINFTTPANRGSVLCTPPQASGTAGTNIGSPLFIFVDYVKVPTETVKAAVGTNGIVSTTYTGSPVLPSDLGLKITNSTGLRDYTADYDIDCNNSAKIEVLYSYTGTNAAGVAESGDGLPVNAGEYSVTMTVADQSAYNKDPVLYKNRRAINYTFTLTVNPAEATRGSLPASVTSTYGTRFSSVFNLNSYKASGVNGESTVEQPGTFSFTVASDGTGYKNVGSGTVEITWTPTYGSDAVVKNYTTTVFTVNYTITKANLVIRPNAAVVVYGNNTFETDFSVELEGLAGNDATSDAVKNSIAGALSYMVEKNGAWVAYNPDQIGAGLYTIRATFEGQLPEALQNYTYTYVFGATDNPYGNLTVKQRPLTVKATAVSREYAYENRAVNVTFEITDGIYGVDDVSVATVAGAVANYNVGTQTVTGIDKAKVQSCLTGGAAANYVVNEVVYATGSSLTVQITQASPVVGTPTTDERFYQLNATLADVEIKAASSSVAGSWQWVDANINPTVATKLYQAKFVPDDSVNYSEKIVDVTVNVKKTPVIVSYEKTVEYGDKKPNITDFTYSAAQDPGFDIEKLDCEGNISVSTTYEQGSPVSSTGYPVNISTAAYVDKAGNYTFTTRNGVIYVSKRVVTFTVQPVEITYGSNFVLNNSTVSVVCDESDLYGSDTVNSVTSDGSAPVFTFTSGYNAQTNYGAGEYTVEAHNNFTTSANYDVEFVPGKLTVNKADLTISAKPLTVEYNTAISDSVLANAYTVTGAKKNETLSQMMTEGTINVDTTYYKGAFVNAEGYPVTIDVSDCKFPNYNVVVSNSVITVIKATPVISELPTASLVHKQRLSQAVFNGGVVEDGVTGTFVFDADTDVVYSAAPIYFAGTFVPDDTDNYNTVAIPQIAVYVSKLPVTGELAITGIAMKGETLTADVSGLDPDTAGVYTFTWSADGTQLGTGTTYTLSDDDIGKVITLTAIANSYYDGTKTAATSQVTPKLTSVATILDTAVYADYFNLGGLDAFGGVTTVNYDGIEHFVTFNLADDALNTASVGSVTVKYNGSATKPKAAGYYNVTVDIGTPEYSNIVENNGKTYDDVNNKYVYSSISGYPIGTLYIAPATYTVTLTFNDKVYDGGRNTTAEYTESGACVLAGGVKDDVAFDAASAVYQFADANVGENKAVTVTGAALKGASAANYTLEIVNTDTAAITPATLKATVEPVSRQYEKDNYTVYLGFTVDVASLAKTDSASQIYIDDSAAYGIIDDDKAGTRFVTVYDAVLAGSKADNYVLELTNKAGLTVEITKATPSYPIPSTGVIYYDSARTLSEISLGYDNWKWDESVRNIIPEAGTHTYKAIFTPNDTENEATVEYNVKLVVNKAPVTVKITSFTNVVYGDAVPTYGYTATGLTGTDTIKKSVDGYILLESNYVPGSPVGNYPIVRTGEFESDNYSFTYEAGSIVVKPRTVYTTASAVSREYEPGNKEVTVNFTELTNIYPGDSATVYLASSSVTGTIPTDGAGSKKVTYTAPALEGDKATNYTLYVYNANVTAEIAKAVISGITFPAGGIVSYGQRLSTTVFDEPYDALGLGTFSMENATTTPEMVGTFNEGYNVVFTPSDSANYATLTQPIRLTVETAAISDVVVAISGTTQVGKTLYASVGNVPTAAAKYVTYQWYRVDNANDTYRDGYMFASGKDSIVLSESEQGKYIIVVATASNGAPYTMNGSAKTDESIQAETLSFWQRLIKWFYKLLSGFTQLFGKK